MAMLSREKAPASRAHNKRYRDGFLPIDAYVLVKFPTETRTSPPPIPAQSFRTLLKLGGSEGVAGSLIVSWSFVVALISPPVAI